MEKILDGQGNIFEIIGIKKKELRLTAKQVRVLCEAMWDFKTHIEEMPKANYIKEKITEYKINEIDELFIILQEIAGYDFMKQLEKCNKKRLDEKEDIGEDALVLSSNKNKESNS